jgi:hypothetical protein
MKGTKDTKEGKHRQEAFPAVIVDRERSARSRFLRGLHGLRDLRGSPPPGPFRG